MRLNMNQNRLSQNQDTVVEVGRQTSQDNIVIERESIPQKRKSWLAPILVTFIIIGIVIYGLAKNKNVLVNIYLSVFSIVLTPVLRCFCIFVEKLCTTCTWTMKNVLNLFKTSFRGNAWKSSFLVLLIIGILLLKRSSFDIELDVISILSGLSVGPLVVYLLKLNPQSDVDLARLLEGKWLHPAYILAWNYYINYLEKALLVFTRRFSSRNLPIQSQVSNEYSDRDAQPEIELSLNKLILLFSHNYEKELRVVDLDNHIRKITDICEPGYKFPVYSVNYNGNEYKFVILFAEEPLESIKRICDFERRKLIHSELLCSTLGSEILSKNSFCRDKCILISISETQSLDNGGLVKLIMNHVQREVCVPESNATNDTELPTLPMRTEQLTTVEPDGTQVPSSPGETSNSQQSVDIDHAESYESMRDNANARADTEPDDPLVSTAEQLQEPDDTLVFSLTERAYHAEGYLHQSSEKFRAPQLRLRTHKKIGDDSALHNLKTSSSILKREFALMKQLQQWLGDKCKWNLCYRASRDGWKAKDFHRHCDNKGPTVVLVKANDCIFGGYTDQHWESSKRLGNCEDPELSFLFSDENLSPSIADIKQGKEQYAIYCHADFGPIFGGGHDLHICDNPQVNYSFSNLGYTYQLPPCEREWIVSKLS